MPLPLNFLRTVWFAVAVLALSAAALADPILISLVVPDQATPAGTDVTIGVLVANPNSVPSDFALPPVLAGRLSTETQTWPVELNGKAPTENTTLAAGGFANRPYTLRLPPDTHGQMILELSTGLPHPLRAVLTIGARVDAGQPPPPEFPDTATPLANNRTEASTLQRSFTDHFTTLDPVYFIYGTKAPAAKFQFSFKYRMLTFDEGTPDSPESTVQFGYTQRSLWDLNASSSPFYDTSYMPSLFYQLLAPAPTNNASQRGITWLGFSTVYQNESNGQASTASRSMNSLFLQTSVLLGRPDQWHAVVTARAFDYVAGLSDNPQLKDYRGYGYWQVVLAKGTGPSLSYFGRAGKDLNHITSQFDLNIPVRTHLLNFATYFLIQYFDGYGESLRAYTSYTDTVRAGISLVR
jgi:phospholipase A1